MPRQLPPPVALFHIPIPEPEPSASPTPVSSDFRRKCADCGHPLRSSVPPERRIPGVGEIGPECAEKRGIVSPASPRIASRRSGPVDGQQDLMKINEGEEMSYFTANLTRIEEDIRAERAAQVRKWGEQNHPDGTHKSHDTEAHADMVREWAQSAAEAGEQTWANILAEEVAEAMAEDDPAKLRAELVQVAAVAAAWIEAIDRREAGAGEPR